MARKLLLLSGLLLSGCVAEQQALYPTPLYLPPESSPSPWAGPPAPLSPRPLGPGPIELRPAPPAPPPDSTQLEPPAPTVEIAPALTNPESEATAAPLPPEGGSEGPDEADVAQRLHQVKARLQAEEGEGPAPRPASRPSAGAAQAAGSSLPTRPGFREHYGALNHSGDVPPHSIGASP
jgi:hypothetical protein